MCFTVAVLTQPPLSTRLVTYAYNKKKIICISSFCFAGSQFLHYIASFALLSTPFELFRVPQRIASGVKRLALWIGLHRSFRRRHEIEVFDYGFNYAVMLHILSVVLFFGEPPPPPL